MGEDELNPIECFKKEVLEEVGGIVNNVNYLGQSNSDSSVFNIYCYLATDVIIDKNSVSPEYTEIIDSESIQSFGVSKLTLP